MMKRILGLSLSALLLIPLSCGGGSSPVGKWTLDGAAMKKAMTANLSADKKKEMESNPIIKGMLDMFTNMKMEMELKADGTCTSTAEIPMQKEPESTTGTWKMDGETLLITMKKKGKDQTQKFKVRGDQLEMLLDEKTKKGGAPSFIFIRK